MTYLYFLGSRPDSRVVRLIERVGSIINTNQKRVLCMNKVDLVEKKKDVLKVVDEFKDLPGYERYNLHFHPFPCYIKYYPMVPDIIFNNFIGALRSQD